MNVSHENKVIWWAPERCATKITAKIFGEADFFVDGRPLSEGYHSHDFEIPSGCEDYKIFCNIRNPYDRIFGIFLNFTNFGINFVYTKDKKQDLITKYENFIDEFVTNNRRFSENQKIGEEPTLWRYFNKMNFFQKYPDYFIRVENLEYDLSKINFMTDTYLWKSGQAKELLEKNSFLKKRPFTFDEIYTEKGANKIFHYFRKQFFLLGYSPFSFTKEILDNDHKKYFLHNIID
jgi:hypothetical protein